MSEVTRAFYRELASLSGILQRMVVLASTLEYGIMRMVYKPAAFLYKTTSYT